MSALPPRPAPLPIAPAPAPLRREVVGGSVGSLAVLAVVLTLGVLGFAPLGGDAARVGLAAAFVTAGIGGMVFALRASASLPAAGPSSATALILADLVARLVSGPQVADLPITVALCGAAVAGSGVLQIVLARLGLARMARQVPQPVLAGFMNGVAVLILLAQLPFLLGHAAGVDIADALAAPQAGALLLGLGTAALALALGRWAPRWPASLVALVVGTTVFGLGPLLWPSLNLGAPVAPSSGVLALPMTLLPLGSAAGRAALAQQAGAVLTTAVLLALIGALESALNTAAIDVQQGTRHAPSQELAALGWTNVVCGSLGGLPAVALRARAMAILQAGGQGRAAALAGSVALLLLYLGAAPWLGLLPLPVLAGVMLTIAWALLDRWSGRLLAQGWSDGSPSDLLAGMGVVALVTVATVWRGMTAAVALGVLLSLVIFAVRMNRSLVHAQYRAAAQPSRRSYPSDIERRLQPLREHITVFEIEGPLFFGSGERLLDEVDRLDVGCRFLVLDLRRVGTIDETGAMALQQAVRRTGQQGVRVLLAGLAEGGAAARTLRTYARELPTWPDADRAVEAAEHALLGDAAWQQDAERPLAQTALLAGLDDDGVAVVTARLRRRELRAGETLFHEGDPGDRLFVLTRGSISVLSRPDERGRSQRYLSISPGMVLGETAMLDGRGRSAGARADVASTVYELSRDDLEALAAGQPHHAQRLFRNLALHLSERLRSAAWAWRASAR